MRSGSHACVAGPDVGMASTLFHEHRQGTQAPWEHRVLPVFSLACSWGRLWGPGRENSSLLPEPLAPLHAGCVPLAVGQEGEQIGAVVHGLLLELGTA